MYDKLLYEAYGYIPEDDDKLRDYKRELYSGSTLSSYICHACESVAIAQVGLNRAVPSFKQFILT